MVDLYVAWLLIREFGWLVYVWYIVMLIGWAGVVGTAFREGLIWGMICAFVPLGMGLLLFVSLYWRDT